MAKTRNFESDDIRTTVEKKERQRRMTFAVEEKSGMKRRIAVYNTETHSLYAAHAPFAVKWKEGDPSCADLIGDFANSPKRLRNSGTTIVSSERAYLLFV